MAYGLVWRLTLTVRALAVPLLCFWSHMNSALITETSTLKMNKKCKMQPTSQMCHCAIGGFHKPKAILECAVGLNQVIKRNK